MGRSELLHRHDIGMRDAINTLCVWW